MLMNTFFKTQFNYFPLVWTLNVRKLNSKIDRLRERLRLRNFDELLGFNNSISVHHRNLKNLVIELYNVFNGISPNIMKDIFFKF